MPEPGPNLAELVSTGRLRPLEPDFETLREMLVLVERDTEAASANEDRFAPWAETMLYEADCGPQG